MEHISILGISWKLEQAIKPFFANFVSEKGEETSLETAVATLLLVVASVVLACSVVTYAVATIEHSVNTPNMPWVNDLNNTVNKVIDQTGIGSQATPQLPNTTP